MKPRVRLTARVRLMTRAQSEADGQSEADVQSETVMPASRPLTLKQAIESVGETSIRSGRLTRGAS